jgi:peroxiredoxin
LTTVGARVGQVAPDFQVKALDGRTLTTADLRVQQKPYILYFFASW